MENILVSNPITEQVSIGFSINNSDSNEILIKPSGDIYVNGKKTKNNKLIVDTLKKIVLELNLQSSK